MARAQCLNDKPNRVQQSKESVDAAIERIAQLTDEQAKSDAIRQHLACMATFHRYSFQNQLLIRMQRPDATLCRGYHQWHGHNRFVCKGAKGIAILVPMHSKKVSVQDKSTDETDELGRPRMIGRLFFGIKHVFDVSDTDGEPLPLADWTGHAGTDDIYMTLAAAAESLGYEVSLVPMSSNGRHWVGTNKIELNESKTPAEWSETLAHELAHAILHGEGKEATTPQEKELEAEATAYAVMSHFGAQTVESANYVALWGGKGQDIKQRMSRIAEAAHKILDACETIEYDAVAAAV